MENIKKIQNAYAILYNALEKANRAGVYTLVESTTISTNAQILREYLQNSLNKIAEELSSVKNNILPSIPESNEE